MAQRWVLISFLCLSLTLFALILVSISALNAVTLLDENWNGFQLTWSDMQLGVAEGSAVASADQRVVRVDTIVSFLNSMKSVFSGLLVLAVVFLVWAVWTTRNTLSPHRLSASSAVSSERLAIKRLTAELELLKQGDLSTVVSDLDPDTAPVAESVNQLVNEFSSVLQSLETASVQLNHTLDQSGRSTDDIAATCAEQSRLIHSCSNFLFSMAASMSGLSADTAECSTVAQTMLENSDSGEIALTATLDKLSAIQFEVDNTSQVMNRLAENIAAIDRSVATVQDVAKRTDLLALNATIRASASSLPSSMTDTSTDLAQLSDEVAQLAEVLGRATGEIGSLTKIIAKDAFDTVKAMDLIASQIALGVARTEDADFALSSLKNSSSVLHSRIRQMTESSVEQSGNVRRLTENADAINQITDQIVERFTANDATLSELRQLASDLKLRVNDFQLPEKYLGKTSTRHQRESAARRAANRAVGV